MLQLETSELYEKELLEFLTERMDDGWGKPFELFSEEDKETILEEFANSAQEQFENLGYQEIKGKYLKVGQCGIFELTESHFNIVYESNISDYKRMPLKTFIEQSVLFSENS